MGRKSRFHKLLHKGQKLCKQGKTKRAGLLKIFMRVLYQCDIPFQAEISPTAYFCHSGFGIFINPKCKIGENTIIQHRVTIGELDEDSGAPVIKNNVYIGAGAIILGNVSIGSNAKIGAGSVVIKDVPDNTTVVGVPAKKICL